jgi:electron transfer flavoprotein alpha subunit/NAD-dependent dihydropyrimidine dehydrogenase PreA subunit
MLKVDPAACTLCGLCRKACPFGAITAGKDAVSVDERCTLCGACVSICPASALSIERRQASAEDLARYRGVFVWAECEPRGERRGPRKVVYELLAHGRRLADHMKEPLVAVAMGDERMHEIERLCAAGADRVIACRHALLGTYSTDGFTTALAAVVAKEKPAVLLFGATPNGRDLAPRVAARLRFGLTADCTGLDIDDEGRLVQTRPAFGGNIMASIVSPWTRPQAATVRPNVFAAAPADRNRPVRIEEFPVTLSKAAIRTRVVEEIATAAEGETIEEARVLVSAGRGCGEPSNLDLVRRLAHRLGGTLSGSRAIVELGWIPHTRQVGQSGTTVGPDLYVAIGISGAIQHVVGMSASRKVVAINKDPDAPIFKVADVGVVGDALQILPKLLEALSKNGP